jgi:CBS domain containing-hemolysin-like protein
MLLDILLTIFLVLLNGFFVAAEFAIVKVRASQVELHLASGSRMARYAMGIVQNLDAYLSATQLGITIASLLLGWIGEAVVSEIITNLISALGYTLTPVKLHTISFIVAFALITVMHIVFGELAPKSIAIRYAERTTLALAVPLRIFYFIFRPFIWILNGMANLVLKAMGISLLHEQDSHNEEEIRILLEHSRESGAIKSSEHELLENVFKFDDRVAEQIMIPRTKMATIDIDASVEETFDNVMEEGYSRWPVYKNSVDNIVGIIYTKDLLKMMKNTNNQGDPLTILRPAYFISEKKPIHELLKEFQREHIHIAIVMDEFGGTAGIVTMEDIIEELVGEIHDEYDEEVPIVVQKNDNEFIVSSLNSLADVNKFLPEPLPEGEDYDTVTGLINFLFGRIPDQNEKIIHQNFEFTILEKSNNAVDSVLIRILPKVEES